MRSVPVIYSGVYCIRPLSCCCISSACCTSYNMYPYYCTSSCFVLLDGRDSFGSLDVIPWAPREVHRVGARSSVVRIHRSAVDRPTSLESGINGRVRENTRRISYWYGIVVSHSGIHIERMHGFYHMPQSLPTQVLLCLLVLLWLSYYSWVYI